MTHRVVVIRGSTAHTLDWSDDSLGEMTGSARRIVTNFVIGVLSESEAARMLITEGFTAQTALRILAMNATKLLAASRSRDEAMTHRRIIIHNGFARDAGGTFSRTSPNAFGKLANQARSAANNEKAGRVYNVYRVKKDGTRATQKSGYGYPYTKEEAERQVASLEKLNPELKFVIGDAKPKDGVGSPEEIAFGEGYHSSENYNPYTSATEKAAWEKGRAAKKQKYRLNQHGAAQGIAAPGMKRKVAFQPPRARVGADYKSEKGYVAKLIDVKTGRELARSEPYISNGPSLKSWVQAKAQELIRQGKRVKAEIAFVFFDPNQAFDAYAYEFPHYTTAELKSILAKGESYWSKRAPGIREKMQAEVKRREATPKSQLAFIAGEHVKSRDATPKSFWSYQTSEPTPSLEEAIALGAINAKTTQVEWDRLSPGFKREIVRGQKRRNSQKPSTALDNWYHAGQVNGYYILEGAQGDKGRWLVRNDKYDIVKTANSLEEASRFARSQKPITPIETKIAADRRSTDAAYLDPKPGAPHVDLLLADALSPKGKWVGPYVQGKLGGYVQAPGSSGYRPYYTSHASHARKLLAVRPSTK
jgi:hypothetical protein